MLWDMLRDKRFPGLYDYRNGENMKEKKIRKTEAEQLEIVAKLRPIDDVFFEKLMEDPDACEEILQVIMENPKLRIKRETLSGQKSIKHLINRSIRVDAYVEGHEEEVFNIEVQKQDNDNHVKRVRYNASAITVNRSEPGDRFEHVQELYVIYISRFDVLKNGLTISHAEMTCAETGKPVNDGLHEIYVNTNVKSDSKVSRLMEWFTETDMEDPEFPKMSSRVQEIKHNPKEVEIMCELIEEYAAKRADQAATQATIQTAIKIARKYGADDDEIADILKTEYGVTDSEIEMYLSENKN